MEYILYAKDRTLLGKLYIVHAGYMHLSHSVASNSFATPWNGAPQAPLSLGLSRKEYWCGLPFSPPGAHYASGSQTWVGIQTICTAC